MGCLRTQPDAAAPEDDGGSGRNAPRGHRASAMAGGVPEGRGTPQGFGQPPINTHSLGGLT